MNHIFLFIVSLFLVSEVNADLLCISTSGTVRVAGSCNGDETGVTVGAKGNKGPTGVKGDKGPQGPAGAKGPTGPKGDKGPKGDAGTVGPQGPAGATGPTGPAGSQGPQGATGSTGANGTNGNSLLNGSGAPTAQGVSGDFYLDTTNNKVYGPKNAGGWGSGISLIGPQGIQGQPGLQGERGLTGERGPIGLTGAVGSSGPMGPASGYEVTDKNGVIIGDLSDAQSTLIYRDEQGFLTFLQVDQNGVRGGSAIWYESNNCTGTFYLPSSISPGNGNWREVPTNYLISARGVLYSYTPSDTIMNTIDVHSKYYDGVCSSGNYQIADRVNDSHLILIKDFTSYPVPWHIRKKQ